MTVKTDIYQVGFDNLAARNFTLDTDIAGALRFRRGKAGETPVATPMYIDANDNLRLLQRGGISPGHSSYADNAAKNLLMNPSGLINQRAVVSTGSNSTYYCDRWKMDTSLVPNQWNIAAQPWADTGGNWGGHVATVQVQKPVLAVGDYGQIMNQPEGIYIRDIFWGASQPTAFQQPVTYSCWAYCSDGPHTFCLVIRNGASASYVHPFTIPKGTWTYVSHTIPAPVIGTWPVDNSAGMQFSICLFAASNGTYTTPSADTWLTGNFIATTNITNFMGWAVNTQFAITAPQLEAGSVATKFARPDFPLELQRCMRYYENSYAYGVLPGSSTVDGQIRVPTFDVNTLLILNTPYRVKKRAANHSFTAWNPSTGGMHNVRGTSTGTTVPLSNYGTISTQGPNLMSSNGLFTASTYFEFQWAADADFG